MKEEKLKQKGRIFNGHDLFYFCDLVFGSSSFSFCLLKAMLGGRSG